MPGWDPTAPAFAVLAAFATQMRLAAATLLEDALVLLALFVVSLPFLLAGLAFLAAVRAMGCTRRLYEAAAAIIADVGAPPRHHWSAHAPAPAPSAPPTSNTGTASATES